MQTKNSTKPRSLADAVERLRTRNDQLHAYLRGEDPNDPVARVRNAPAIGLDDATARASKYWDKLEGRRSSVPAGPR
jgi:hypothetical protein